MDGGVGRNPNGVETLVIVIAYVVYVRNVYNVYKRDVEYNAKRLYSAALLLLFHLISDLAGVFSVLSPLTSLSKKIPDIFVSNVERAVCVTRWTVLRVTRQS